MSGIHVEEAVAIRFSNGWQVGYEPIVRCRDCMKWHHIDTLDGVRYGECDEWKRADSYCVPATRENGFCAWATCKCGEDIETNGCEWVVCPSCGRVIRA